MVFSEQLPVSSSRRVAIKPSIFGGNLASRQNSFGFAVTEKIFLIAARRVRIWDGVFHRLFANQGEEASFI